MKTWVKIVSGLVTVGIIAAFLVYFFIYNKPHPDYETMDATFTVTAGDLYKAFTADKTLAGNKYNGKVIEVSGRLSKVEVSDSLTTCVFVFSQGVFGDEGLRCTMLKKFSGEARKFQPDGEVKLKGYCTGFNDTDVILDKCSILNQ
ncbi:MAG: hypothetical protein WCI71_11250 [Bacteroidota bacterium]